MRQTQLLPPQLSTGGTHLNSAQVLTVWKGFFFWFTHFSLTRRLNARVKVEAGGQIQPGREFMRPIKGLENTPFKAAL